MRVTVRLLTGMKCYLPTAVVDGDSCEISVAADGTVATVLSQLEIPADRPKTVLVNRLHAGPETVLGDGDVLSIFEPISGG